MDTKIPDYPDSIELTAGLRPFLHPMFKGLDEGISEFTFANIYLFRETHNYRITRLGDGSIAFAGSDRGTSFFMLPFGLPEERLLRRLFEDFPSMKGASEKQAALLADMGYSITEDRDNFDYLYSREELATLKGRKFHRKKNLVNLFTSTYICRAEPLLEGYKNDALAVLDGWLAGQTGPGDYAAAKEAVEGMDELELCGRIYYIGKRPVAFTLGEELREDTFVIHFEKGLSEYKGLLQFINQDFASRLPEKYGVINMEQDLGVAGLRKSKLSYRPIGFIKKYRAALKKQD